MSNMVPVPEDKRQGFKFPSAGPEPVVYMTWQAWVDYATALNQEIAKRMREYGGPAEQDEPPTGGTPVLMRRAA